MAPPLGRQDCKIAQKSEQNWGMTPLCKLGIILWARNHLILGENGTKFKWRPFFCFSPDFDEKWDEIWVETFFFFVLHLILGENWDEIWVWQFQILIYVPLKFSEVSGPPPPFSKFCVRYYTSLMGKQICEEVLPYSCEKSFSSNSAM